MRYWGLLLLGVVVGCSSSTEKRTYERVYHLARRYGDYWTMKEAAYALWAQDTTNLAWKDSLFRCYVFLKQVSQVIRMGEERLRRNPKDLFALNALAEAYQLQGDIQKAYEYQVRAYDLAPNRESQYHLAVLLYNMGRSDTALKLVSEVAKDSTTKAIMVHVSGQGATQEVPLQAAAWNLIGVIHMIRQDVKEAKKAFEQALSIAPNFLLARNNYLYLLQTAP